MGKVTGSESQKAYKIRQKIKIGAETGGDITWLNEYESRTGHAVPRQRMVPSTAQVTLPVGESVLGMGQAPGAPMPSVLHRAPPLGDEIGEGGDLPPIYLPGVNPISPSPGNTAPIPPRESQSSIPPPAEPAKLTAEQLANGKQWADELVRVIKESNRTLEREFPGKAIVLPDLLIDKLVHPAATRIAARYITIDPSIDNEIVDGCVVVGAGAASIGQLYMRRAGSKADRPRTIIDVPSSPNSAPSREETPPANGAFAGMTAPPGPVPNMPTEFGANNRPPGGLR